MQKIIAFVFSPQTEKRSDTPTESNTQHFTKIQRQIKSSHFSTSNPSMGQKSPLSLSLSLPFRGEQRCIIASDSYKSPKDYLYQLQDIFRLILKTVGICICIKSKFFPLNFSIVTLTLQWILLVKYLTSFIFQFYQHNHWLIRNCHDIDQPCIWQNSQRPSPRNQCHLRAGKTGHKPPLCFWKKVLAFQVFPTQYMKGKYFARLLFKKSL